MKISWVKKDDDNNSFKFVERIGMNVEKLNNPDLIDEKIKDLLKQHYDTFVITSDIAGFSEDLIKKYQNNNNINIIIAKRK